MAERDSYDNRFNLIAEYGLAKFGREIPIDKIKEAPNEKKVKWWWDARLHFRLRTYPSFEDIPDTPDMKDGNAVYVRYEDIVDTYYWNERLQKWEFGGGMNDWMYKG